MAATTPTRNSGGSSARCTNTVNSLKNGGLTKQNLQDNGPEVSRPGGWELGCLPHKVGRLEGVSFKSAKHDAARHLMTYHCLNYISKVISHGNQEGTLLRIIGADLIDPGQDQGTGTSLGSDVSYWHQNMLYAPVSGESLLTPMLASQ